MTTEASHGATAHESACTCATRRQALAATGVVGATAMLAACGSGDAGAGEAGSGAAGSGGSGSGSDSGNSSVEVDVSGVAVGGGVVDGTAKVVVTEPSDGTYAAFSAICTHQGCVVAGVADNVITCGCHGSAFDAATGEVVRGPATTALPSRTVSVDGGTATVS